MKHKLAACLLSMLPTIGLTQDIPKNLEGVWATPSCTAATDTLVIYNSFYLWIGEQETALTGFALAPSQPEEWVILEESDGYPNFFKLLPDGKLRESFLPDNAEFDSMPNQDWQATDYEPCGNAMPRNNALLHGEPAAVLQAVSDVQTLCETDRQACANQLFASFDVSGDGKLSTAEVARLLRVAGYVAAVSEATPAENNELAGVLAAGLPLGPLMASAIINSFDYNDDGGVSLEELSQDRGALIDQIEPNTGDELNSRLDRMKEP